MTEALPKPIGRALSPGRYQRRATSLSDFAEQLGLTKDAVEGVNRINAEEGVEWIFSFLSADKKKTYCLYEAPNPDGNPRRGAPRGRSGRRDHGSRRRNRPDHVQLSTRAERERRRCVTS